MNNYDVCPLSLALVKSMKGIARLKLKNIDAPMCRIIRYKLTHFHFFFLYLFISCVNEFKLNMKQNNS